MKIKLYRRILAAALAVAMLCSMSMIVSAVSTGTETWTARDVTYSAVVRNNSTITTKEVPILSSQVTIMKHGRHKFGNCTYEVSFSSNMWQDSRFSKHLDSAGAKVSIHTSYSESIYFSEPYSFTAANYTGTFCALTTGYGYEGSYYVEELGFSPTTMEHGSFTFAPFKFGNVITGVIDVNIY